MALLVEEELTVLDEDATCTFANTLASKVVDRAIGGVEVYVDLVNSELLANLGGLAQTTHLVGCTHGPSGGGVVDGEGVLCGYASKNTVLANNPTENVVVLVP